METTADQPKRRTHNKNPSADLFTTDREPEHIPMLSRGRAVLSVCASGHTFIVVPSLTICPAKGCAGLLQPKV